MTNNFLYVNDEDLGLSAFVASPRSRGTSSAPVNVETAHRAEPATSRLNSATPNFKFSYDPIKNYHQLWIFAADYPSRAGDVPPISDDERRAITRFMDEGGGVYATGDHEDPGVTVGEYLPRIGSMRHWFFGVPDPSPQGEPITPDGTDATRHDINRPGHTPGWQFDDQSDHNPRSVRVIFPQVIPTPGGFSTRPPNKPSLSKSKPTTTILFAARYDGIRQRGGRHDDNNRKRSDAGSERFAWNAHCSGNDNLQQPAVAVRA